MGETMALDICFSESDFMAVFLVFLPLAGGLAIILCHNGCFVLYGLFSAPATRNGFESEHHSVIPSLF